MTHHHPPPPHVGWQCERRAVDPPAGMGLTHHEPHHAHVQPLLRQREHRGLRPGHHTGQRYSQGGGRDLAAAAAGHPAAGPATALPRQPGTGYGGTGGHMAPGPGGQF